MTDVPGDRWPSCSTCGFTVLVTWQKTALCIYNSWTRKTQRVAQGKIRVTKTLRACFGFFPQNWGSSGILGKKLTKELTDLFFRTTCKSKQVFLSYIEVFFKYKKQQWLKNLIFYLIKNGKDLSLIRTISVFLYQHWSDYILSFLLICFLSATNNRCKLYKSNFSKGIRRVSFETWCWISSTRSGTRIGKLPLGPASFTAYAAFQFCLWVVLSLSAALETTWCPSWFGRKTWFLEVHEVRL